MRYQNVCVEAFGHTLPEERVSSTQLESWLNPLYQRLRLPEGRLELMTGISERRFWPPGMLPSQMSVVSGKKALQQAGIDPGEIGALIHASVCRDYLEPATACGVHHQLGLSPDCVIYDVSNACLGVLNGMLQIANMIELGQIRAGMVVATESSRPLVESTIAQLNADTSLTREQLKLAIASLTIGSGSAAVVLCDRDLSRSGNRLVAGVARTNTAFNQLCHSGRDEAVAGDMRPLMQTDSEKLMREGIDTAARAFDSFQQEIGWSIDQIDKTFCHQIGLTHRKLLFEKLGLNTAIDYSTVEWLGNTGSVALPMTAAIGIENGHLQPHDHVAMMGIGSGINVVMLGVEWQRALVGGKPVASHAKPTVKAS